MNHSFSRRDFLRNSLGTCALLTGFPIKKIFGFNPFSEGSKKPDLAVVKGDAEKAVQKAIELLGGIKQFVQPGDRVLIKPNVSFPNPPSWGTTTNPAVVRAVIKLSLDAGAGRVIVADHTMRDSDICFEKTGFADVLSDFQNVKWMNLNQERFFQSIPVAQGKAINQIHLAKLVTKCNVLINIPCAKSHSATQVSLGLKNLMGLIWDRSYFHTRTNLHQGLADLALTIQPHLTILDGTRALQTGGPTGPGKVIPLNTIVAGTDPLAVDAYGVSLSPWNNRSLSAQDIQHLAFASQMGVGQINLNQLNIQELEC